MLIIMQNNEAVAQLLPPVIEENGAESPAEAAGFVCTDCMVDRGLGLYQVRRTLANESGKIRVFKLINEAKTLFTPDQYLIPCVMYNGNHWGEGNSPKGLTYDGQPWVFAYDRIGIPSCTLTENLDYGFALFASDEDENSLRTSASLIKQDDGCFIHRIYYPVTEAPVTYASKNIMKPRHDEFITLTPGEQFSVVFYLFACTPKWGHFACANLLDRMPEVFPFDKQPLFTPNRVWELGMAYLKRLIHDYQGQKLIIAGMDTKVSRLQAIGQLTMKDPEAMQRAMDVRENNVFGYNRVIYEIGWAGQGFLICRMFMKEALEKGDMDMLQACLSMQDAWVEKQEENGMILAHFERYAQLEEAKQSGRLSRASLCEGFFPEVCNLGWGASEMSKIYLLLQENGIDKPEYLRFATRICDFFCKNYSDEYGFGKSFTLEGQPLDTTGSVGGFMINGLIDTYRATGNAAYLDTAKRGLDFYFNRDVNQFVCTAGAIDCVAVDKETAFPFVISSLDLYELTGEGKYLEYAKKAAYYFYSWTFQYDALYPDSSDFKKYGFYTAGGTAISAEHHAIDPWGSLLTPEFVRLWKFTGDENWLLWARMMWCQALLGITKQEGDIVLGKPRPLGSQNEGFFQARWTKYRPDCEERGHFNDWLVSWVSAYRLTALDRLTTAAKEQDWHLFA